MDSGGLPLYFAVPPPPPLLPPFPPTLPPSPGPLHRDSFNDREKAVLEQFYLTSRGVNYREFLDDLRPPPSVPELFRATAERTQAAATNRQDFHAGTGAGGKDPELVLDKIRACVKRERMRLIEHLAPFDRLRSGLVTASKYVCAGREAVPVAHT